MRASCLRQACRQAFCFARPFSESLLMLVPLFPWGGRYSQAKHSAASIVQSSLHIVNCRDGLL
jgi:hypothetical protein